MPQALRVGSHEAILLPNRHVGDKVLRNTQVVHVRRLQRLHGQVQELRRWMDARLRLFCGDLSAPLWLFGLGLWLLELGARLLRLGQEDVVVFTLVLLRTWQWLWRLSASKRGSILLL